MPSVGWTRTLTHSEINSRIQMVRFTWTLAIRKKFGPNTNVLLPQIINRIAFGFDKVIIFPCPRWFCSLTPFHPSGVFSRSQGRWFISISLTLGWMERRAEWTSPRRLSAQLNRTARLQRSPAPPLSVGHVVSSGLSLRVQDPLLLPPVGCELPCFSKL
jgi:hypothetical protein